MIRLRTPFAWIALLVTACASALWAGESLASSDVANAAMRQDFASVKALVRARANVNEPQPDGTTALHWAAHYGDVQTAAALLKARANPSAVTDTGITPLSLACEAGNVEVVRLLLKARADPNQPLRNGETPLMMAARTGSVPVIELLVSKGAKLEAQEKLRGTTALMWAAANSNPEAVRALIRLGANFNARSATTPPGRKPYLAPPGRERIQEFIDGTGLRGAVVEQKSGEASPPPTATANASAGGAATGDGAASSASAPSAGGSPAAHETPKVDAETSNAAAERESAKRRFEAEQAAARAAIAKFPPAAEYARRGDKQWGGLTPLLFATRDGNLDTVKALLDAGANVNQQSEYGWTALLTATQNRYYKLAMVLLDHGANPNLANAGGWTPLYIATDNRNIEAGDYPTRKPDLDHLEFIERLLAAGADPNQRMHSSTETRTVFTHQWLNEEGATPFLRAAQSGDIVLMKLLLEHGADPSIATDHNVTPLMVASGIGWVEGVTYEWSPQSNLKVIELLIELGADVNAQDTLDGRTALMGAAHKGRNEVVQLLVDHGADLSKRDIGSRDSIHTLAGVTWQAIDYADGLVRVGVQSAIPHPETSALLRKLMKERGLTVPAEGRTLASICVTALCK